MSHSSFRNQADSVWWTWRTQAVSNSSIELFRIALGVSLVVEMACVWKADLVSQSYRAAIRTPLQGWEWVPVFPGAGSSAHLCFIGLLGLLIAVGWCTRFSLWVACLAFGQLLLLDESGYLNHHYLMVLLCGLMGAMPVGRRWCFRQPNRQMVVPLSCLWTLRYMIALPYLFGGLAKINADWLAGEPLGHWFRSRANLPFLGPCLVNEQFIQVSCWGSLLLDVAAPFLLLWRPTRTGAFVILTLFHVLNAMLWNIGAFPLLMITGSTIFFEPDWAEFRVQQRSNSKPVPVQPWPRSIAGMSTLLCFILLQTIVPMRFWMLSENVRWTGEGAQFSWLMMHKRVEGAVIYEIVNPQTGERVMVDPSSVLSPRQLAILPGSVHLIRQTALALARSVKTESGIWPKVFARTLVSMNGHPPQAIVRDDMDLADVRLLGEADRQLIVPINKTP